MNGNSYVAFFNDFFSFIFYKYLNWKTFIFKNSKDTIFYDSHGFEFCYDSLRAPFIGRWTCWYFISIATYQ